MTTELLTSWPGHEKTNEPEAQSPSGLSPGNLSLPLCQAEHQNLSHIHGPLENIPDLTVAGQD